MLAPGLPRRQTSLQMRGQVRPDRSLMPSTSLQGGYSSPESQASAQKNLDANAKMNVNTPSRIHDGQMKGMDAQRNAWDVHPPMQHQMSLTDPIHTGAGGHPEMTPTHFNPGSFMGDQIDSSITPGGMKGYLQQSNQGRQDVEDQGQAMRAFVHNLGRAAVTGQSHPSLPELIPHQPSVRSGGRSPADAADMFAGSHYSGTESNPGLIGQPHAYVQPNQAGIQAGNLDHQAMMTALMTGVQSPMRANDAQQDGQIPDPHNQISRMLSEAQAPTKALPVQPRTGDWGFKPLPSQRPPITVPTPAPPSANPPNAAGVRPGAPDVFQQQRDVLNKQYDQSMMSHPGAPTDYHNLMNEINNAETARMNVHAMDPDKGLKAQAVQQAGINAAMPNEQRPFEQLAALHQARQLVPDIDQHLARPDIQSAEQSLLRVHPELSDPNHPARHSVQEAFRYRYPNDYADASTPPPTYPGMLGKTKPFLSWAFHSMFGDNPSKLLINPPAPLAPLSPR